MREVFLCILSLEYKIYCMSISYADSSRDVLIKKLGELF